MLDLMIHDIGIVLALVKSPIRRIDSVGISVLSKTEDIANARIEFANGCVANLSASRMSLKKNREIRVFQDNAYLSLDFMNQAGHLVKKSDIIAYGLKLKVGLAKAGEDKVPVHEIPIEKGEPLAWKVGASDPNLGAPGRHTTLNTVVIHGDRDETVPLSDSLAWAAAREVPVVVVPGGEHFFHRKLHVLREVVARWAR